MTFFAYRKELRVIVEICDNQDYRKNVESNEELVEYQIRQSKLL